MDSSEEKNNGEKKLDVNMLVEMLDIRPLENVLGVEMLQPKQVLYICPEGTGKNMETQLKTYFTHRNLEMPLSFVTVNTYDTWELIPMFREYLEKHPDAVIDITGGTDAVLFAAGQASAETNNPVITYSRTQNKLYSIQNAQAIHGMPCDITLTVEDCFLMAGGHLRQGRVDNSILSGYLDDIGPFFSVFLKYRTRWDRIVTYIQRVSAAREDGSYSLEVEGSYTVKGEQGGRVEAPEEALRDLEEIRMISDLKITEKETVSFRFRDAQVRYWLRDVGSVLELYIYKACLDSGLFYDVITSAIVDWNVPDKKGKTVSNELDVMCTRGIMPVFISCKTSMIKTEALNELAVLRDRFGGHMARAAIVTATRAGSPARNRAAELNIRVIDLNDLQKDGALADVIRKLV